MVTALDDYDAFIARTQAVIADLTATEADLVARLRAVRAARRLLRAMLADPWPPATPT